MTDYIKVMKAKYLKVVLVIIYALLLLNLKCMSTDRSTSLKIVFSKGDNIWIMNIDGSTQGQLTSANSDDTPSFSNDCAKIVFARNSGNSAIYVMNVNGRKCHSCFG
jgi:Tol biopolymer transport system component